MLVAFGYLKSECSDPWRKDARGPIENPSTLLSFFSSQAEAKYREDGIFPLRRSEI